MAASIIDIITLENGDELAVTIEWSPDPKTIEAIMLDAATKFDDWTIPLAEARELMINSTESNFEGEHDPFGTPWQELSEKYARTKQLMGAPDQILVLSSKLKDAATSEENWIVTRDSVFFNTDALPRNEKDGTNYGLAHQAGTAPEGVGKVLAKLSRGESITVEEAGMEFGGGSGNSLPKRSFLGVDYATFDEIEAIFVNWMDRTVTDYIRWTPAPVEYVSLFSTNVRAFGGGTMLRGPGGRFVGVSR